uniref:Multifunctional fusion protein n=1 Tax=Hydropuntia rangiferina TaxID=338881 RepID=A0A345U8D4_9FLOR|nr:translation elongation factor Ts [Hydropuntia rangiferina]AXI96720.1 translation elongation factor Ts [Hydropuntia rangiferina]UAD87403.1 translation elongation factor Ts [Hydropuntia rangiferina]
MQVSSHIIKELRSKTGAGMMDCKKALQAAEGNITVALDSLRKKGLASADKKSARSATEGIIDSYIHTGSKIGVLVELNCETDFVARRIEFQQLAKNLAMQIAACQNVFYISIDDIPQNVIDNEISIESEKEDLINKPVNMKDRIIQGRINKRLQEMSLLNQPFIKDHTISVENLIKKHIALLGENIKIRRFQRFLLGEVKD